MERIKKPNDHRQGKLIRLVDNIQALLELRHKKDFVISDGGEDFRYNPEIIEEMLKFMDSLRNFDITELGNLYLTSGGRVVIDKGYGEYFNGGDKVICTLDELETGIELRKFLSLLGASTNK